MKRGKALSPLGSLLATLGVATILGSPLLAQSITLRGTSNNFTVVVIDETPNSFSFNSVSNVEPGDIVVASPVVTVGGLDVPVSVSVSGQGSPKFRINGGGLVTSGTVSNGDTVELSLQTSPGALNTNYTARLTIGTFGANFNVSTRSGDITPDAFAFSTVTNAEPGTITATPTVTVAGLDSSVTASVTGTGAPRLRINGGALTTSGTVSNGSTVQLVLTDASAFQTTYNATVTIGNGTGTFQATTRTGDVTPDAFSFTSASSAEPGTTITSNTVTLAGFEGSLPISVTGDGSPKIKINGAAAVSSGNVSAGDTVAVEVNAAAGAYSTSYTASVTVGASSSSFQVTTRAADSTPDAFSFTAVTDAAVSSTVSSNIVTLAGFDGTIPVSIGKSGLGTACYKINGGTCGTDASTVSSGDTVQIEVVTSSGAGDTTIATLNAGGVTADYSVTNVSNCQTKTLSTLALGEASCTAGRNTIYAGTYSSARIYVTEMTGTYQWKTTDTSTTGTGVVGDGTGNTNAMATAGIALHPAGQACRALGSEWYLPARDELVVVRTNKATGLLASLDTSVSGGFWSSYQTAATTASFVGWSGTNTAVTKTTSRAILCMRR